MSRSQRAVPVVAVYWILLASGLALFATSRPEGATALAPLWIGAVGGTLIGQCLALRSIRMWMIIVVLAIAAWLTIVGLEIAIIVSGAWFQDPRMAAVFDVKMLWQAFVPAVLCGYWSLGDRSALAACWFPAVLWMLTILDRTDGKFAPDGAGVVLLAGFGALFLVVLRVRESRRVGLWQTVAPVPLAAMKPPELLKQQPRLELARAGWGVSIGAITVAITAWLAPHLWRLEPLRGDTLTASGLASAPPGLPCCPTARATGRERVTEYLDLGRGHDKHVSPYERLDCRVCAMPAVAGPVVRGPAQRGRVVTTPGHAGPAVAIADGPMGPVASVPADRWPRAPELADGPDSPSSGLAPVVAPPPELVASPPTTDPAVTSLPLPGARPAATPLPLPDARPAAILPPPQNARPAATLPPSGVDVRADAPHQPASPAFGASLLRGLIALAAAALIFQLVGFALRPLRRMLTLRHLRTPLWDETVDQRVSNSWQLALVGLRDAGWCPGASEPPQALARRVGIDSLERCATILERARHGLGVDAEDLAIMRASADDAYRAARTDLGAFARAVGYMRWPLT